MTTAIEQAKREMYYALQGLKGRIEINYSVKDMLSGVDGFEMSLEDYLEQLRQQYEEMASTAHSRFESIQSLEAANQKLIQSLAVLTADRNEARHISQEMIDERNAILSQLAKMTESRDMFRNLHQAATHSAIERVGEAATVHQDSGDRGSCAASDAKTMAILGVVVDCQQIVTDWAVYGYRAKKQMKKLAYVLNNNPELTQAMKSFEKPSCMHSFFAIGSDQVKCTFCGVGK